LQRSTDFKFSANPQKGGWKNMKKIISLAVLAAVIGGLVIAGPSESAVTAQQAQPIPSANDDVRAVAGLLLAQELLNIASLTAITPSGMLKLATAPMQGWEAVGGVGVTAQARAAASSSGLARSEVLLAPATAEFQVTPGVKIKNPLLQRAGSAQNNMLNSIYGAMKAAEGAGQMELAYALASMFLTNGLFNFFNRGVPIGLAGTAFVEIATDKADVDYEVNGTKGTVAAGESAEVAVQAGQTVKVTAKGDTKVTLTFLDKDKKEITKVEKALKGAESLSEKAPGRIDNCLARNDIKLEISDPSSGRTTEFAVECSGSKALRAVVATEIAPGAFSFFGPLVGIECPELLQRATDPQATSGARLAAARAYVQGVQSSQASLAAASSQLKVRAKSTPCLPQLNRPKRTINRSCCRKL
jgi:hypothetical protein